MLRGCVRSCFWAPVFSLDHQRQNTLESTGRTGSNESLLGRGISCCYEGWLTEECQWLDSSIPFCADTGVVLQPHAQVPYCCWIGLTLSFDNHRQIHACEWHEHYKNMMRHTIITSHPGILGCGISLRRPECSQEFQPAFPPSVCPVPCACPFRCNMRLTLSTPFSRCGCRLIKPPW